MEMNQSSDHWVKCISTPGNMRGVAIQATALVQSMADRHGVKGIAAQGLGEAVVGALLIASSGKPGERINLNVRGSGHYQQALVDAYPEGIVRGFVVERELPGPAEENVGPWGLGLMSVLRTKDEEGRKPYIGTVPLLTGHLAKDLTFYWAQSEQIPSAVGLAVSLDGDRVLAAGGFLVQALPTASPSEVRAVEQHIKEIQSLADSLQKSSSPMVLLSQIFQSSGFLVVEEKNIEFKCNCSWERVQRALTLVGKVELEAMLKEDHKAVIKCDFCSTDYRLDQAMLEQLIQGEKLQPPAQAE
jgi:molecular chaperone Hsp33